MIKAEFFTTESGSIKSFRIKGHSGYSDFGSDIVCASVSSSVMLAVNTAVEFFEVKLSLDVEDGDIKCGIREISSESDRLFKSLMSHLCEVSKEFPKNLKVVLSSV